MNDVDIPKLTSLQATNLEGKLTIKELGEALKAMKNNKTPGLDGFPAEFLKVFWNQLKFYILRALNHSYEKGIMPISLRHCVISCLPKGDKPRELLKNWRPISLLSVIYKLASAAISNRIKGPLNALISRSQTGFIPGRYIGESTRLVYDLMHLTESKKIDGMLMLIDFEKAFDSISWKFLYKTMNIFGFSDPFVKWIKLFNNEIKSSVIQCDILSEPFNISRGARQGDPIAAYEFILCAEILSLLLKNNKDIRGINIEGIEYRLTQFADDTTLFLDGTKESLQATLNVLEIFGSISGLKMNTEKTKIIWIGHKKYSEDQYNVTLELDWGSRNFVLLGLYYDVNLKQMVEINFRKCLNTAKGIISQWRKRNLTPIGKIAVIKTFILSKFNHIFMCLPSPSLCLMKELDTLIYRFLWNEKPDRINRKQITQGYLKGGLNMINIQNFVQSLKSTWIRRLLKDPEAIWAKLFETTIFQTNKLVLLGPQFCSYYKQFVQNEFWKNVLDSWVSVSQLQTIKTRIDILSSPLWYNPLISKYNFYLSDWFKRGIIYVRDMLDNTGKIKTINDISITYQFNARFLDYCKVKLLVKRFLAEYQMIFNIDSVTVFPILPQHVSVLIKNQTGGRDMYRLLNYANVEFVGKNKWNTELNKNLDHYFWRILFKACFKTAKDPSLIWLQYRILSRILGTKSYLCKLRIHNNDACRLCGEHIETILHIFFQCKKTKEIWTNLKQWILNCVHLEIQLNPLSVILGYYTYDSNFIPINTIFMAAKSYIFNCVHFQRQPNIYVLQSRIKSWQKLI